MGNVLCSFKAVIPIKGGALQKTKYGAPLTNVHTWGSDQIHPTSYCPIRQVWIVFVEWLFTLSALVKNYYKCVYVCVCSGVFLLCNFFVALIRLLELLQEMKGYYSFTQVMIPLKNRLSKLTSCNLIFCLHRYINNTQQWKVKLISCLFPAHYSVLSLSITNICCRKQSGKHCLSFPVMQLSTHVSHPALTTL